MPKISALNEILLLSTASYLPVVDNQETQRVTMGAILDYVETEIDDLYVRHTELEATISAYTLTESFHNYTASVELWSASLSETIYTASLVFGEHTASVNGWTASAEVSTSLFVSGYYQWTASVSTSLALIGEYTAAFYDYTASLDMYASTSIAFYSYTASNDATISAIISGFNDFTASVIATASAFSASLINEFNIITASVYAFTQSYYIDSASFDQRITSNSVDIVAIQSQLNVTGSNIFLGGITVSGSIVQRQAGLQTVVPGTMWTKMGPVYYDYPINYPASRSIDLLSGSYFTFSGTKTFPAEFFASSSQYIGKTISVVAKGNLRPYEPPPLATTRSIVTYIEIGGTPIPPTYALHELLGNSVRPFDIEYNMMINVGNIYSIGSLKVSGDNYQTTYLPLGDGLSGFPASGLSGEMKLIVNHLSSIDQLTGSYAAITILN